MASRDPLQLLGFEHQEFVSTINNVTECDLVLFEFDESDSSLSIIDLIIRGQQMVD